MAELKKRALPVSPENEKEVREDLRRQYGMAAFAVLSLPEIRSLYEKGADVYIDGLYSWEEYKVLNTQFGSALSLWAINTDKELRYRRLERRKQRPLTIAEAAARDIAEIENLQKGGPIAFADYTLQNNKTTADLYHIIDSLLERCF